MIEERGQLLAQQIFTSIVVVLNMAHGATNCESNIVYFIVHTMCYEPWLITLSFYSLLGCVDHSWSWLEIKG